MRVSKWNVVHRERRNCNTDWNQGTAPPNGKSKLESNQMKEPVTQIEELLSRWLQMC